MSAATMSEMERLRRERDEARVENTALAAHVEEVETLLQGAQLGLRWFRDEHPDEDTEADAEFDTQVSVALQSGPTTSLARLKAEWQAEALESLEADAHPHIRIWLKDEAKKLRRQAEGGE